MGNNNQIFLFSLHLNHQHFFDLYGALLQAIHLQDEWQDHDRTTTLWIELVIIELDNENIIFHNNLLRPADSDGYMDPSSSVHSLLGIFSIESAACHRDLTNLKLFVGQPVCSSWINFYKARPLMHGYSRGTVAIIEKMLSCPTRSPSRRSPNLDHNKYSQHEYKRAAMALYNNNDFDNMRFQLVL